MAEHKQNELFSDAEERDAFVGEIYRVSFRNEENGWTVARVLREESEETVTVVGIFPDPSPGVPLRFSGIWGSHPKFGRQFQAEDIRMDTPSTEKGLIKFLSSGLIQGVGKVMAERMVKKFGMELPRIIKEQPRRLAEVPGIGRKKAKQIAESFNEHEQLTDVMVFLQSHGIGFAHAYKIYKQYGDKSVETVSANPYRLARDIEGIGFLTADRIAGDMGVPHDSPHRIEAGLLYALKEAADAGHAFLPEPELTAEAVRLLKVEPEFVESALGRAAEQLRLVRDEERIYLPEYYRTEFDIAQRIKTVIQCGLEGGLAPRLKAIEKKLGIEFAPEQKEAVTLAAGSPVMILTGGPGTGKTETVRGILAHYRSIDSKVLLAAPTGRAAKKLSETAAFPACTIHRLLEYQPHGHRFARSPGNPIEAALVLIDEASMVDMHLMKHLLRAVKPPTRLVLVGDVDQLPSVGAGNVLDDLIRSQKIPTMRLTRIFRQARESLIVVNAHRIRDGEMPEFGKGPNQDFFFISEDNADKIPSRVIELVTRRLPGFMQLDPTQDIQVISPMYRGKAGVDRLNAELQEALNPGRDYNCGPRKLRIGDKVMQTRNNYDLEVFNGDIGMVDRIDEESRSVVVSFGGLSPRYSFTELDQLTLAYAVTVHKSQGSEYPVTILPLATEHYAMLERNLLYTAVTRARRLVVVVGSPRALEIAVRNNRISLRHTFLRERVVRALDGGDCPQLSLPDAPEEA